MVVNNFNKVESLNEKDKGIAPNVIKKAVKTNVLILRTIDLCYAYSLIEMKKLTTSKLLDIIKTEMVGYR